MHFYVKALTGLSHGRRKGGLAPHWILKLLAKKVVFQFRGVKKISPFLAPHGKNLSKAHGLSNTLYTEKLKARAIVKRSFKRTKNVGSFSAGRRQFQ